MDNYIFDKLNESHISEAMDLVKKVFDEFESPFYTEEGINSFYKFIDKDNIKNKLLNNEITLYGCFLDGKIIGVIGLRNPNHICLLFIDKMHHKKGLASKLYNIIKNSCLNSSSREITVNSSCYAVEFYHKLGFIDTDKETIKDGIRFTPMKINI